jgi:hypothetical protein
MNAAQSSTDSPSDDVVVVVAIIKEEEIPYFDGLVLLPPYCLVFVEMDLHAGDAPVCTFSILCCLSLNTMYITIKK